MRNRFSRIKFSEAVWESLMPCNLTRLVPLVPVPLNLKPRLTRAHPLSSRVMLRGGTQNSNMQLKRGKITRRSTIRGMSLLQLLLTPTYKTQVSNIRRQDSTRKLGSSIPWNLKLPCILTSEPMIPNIKESWKEGRAVNRCMLQQSWTLTMLVTLLNLIMFSNTKITLLANRMHQS